MISALVEKFSAAAADPAVMLTKNGYSRLGDPEEHR